MKTITDLFGMMMDLFIAGVIGMMLLGYDVIGFAAQLLAVFLK